MDIIYEITQDHATVRTWLERVRAPAGSLRARRQAFQVLAKFLMAHTEAEEKSVYAFARRVPELKPRTLVAHEEHTLAEALLERTRKTKSAGLWQARAELFCAWLDRHLREEENHYLPELRHYLSEQDEDDLCGLYRDLMPEARPVFPQEGHEEPGGKIIRLPVRRLRKNPAEITP